MTESLRWRPWVPGVGWMGYGRRSMRALSMVTFLFGATALADYPPPSVRCTVPSECTTCVSARYDAAVADCIGGSIDAGLSLSECFDFTGASSLPDTKTQYYCPPGVVAYRTHAQGCSCTTAEALVAMFFAMVPFLLLRRRRSR